MKTLLTLMLVLAFTTVSYGQASQGINQTYDKFKDLTSLSTRIGIFSPSGGVASWMVQAEFTGQEAVNPKIFLMLLSVNDKWKYLKVPDLSLRAIADSKPVTIGKMVRADSDVSDGNTIETLTMIISLKTLETLGNYSTLETQVGSDEFAFTTDQIAKFKLMADKLKELMPAKATSTPAKRKN